MGGRLMRDKGWSISGAVASWSALRGRPPQWTLAVMSAASPQEPADGDAELRMHVRIAPCRRRRAIRSDAMVTPRRGGGVTLEALDERTFELAQRGEFEKDAAATQRVARGDGCAISRANQQKRNRRTSHEARRPALRRGPCGVRDVCLACLVCACGVWRGCGPSHAVGGLGVSCARAAARFKTEPRTLS